MPTFCRHNRFVERCPICSKSLPGHAAQGREARAPARRRSEHPRAARGGTPRAEGVRVRQEQRAADDGFRSPLLPGVRSSADAQRLAEEIAFSAGRLQALATAPPGAYAQARALAGDPERAVWACLLIAYLSPLQDEDGEGDPFAGIRPALERVQAGELELGQLPLGPRSCHDPARGAQTLVAFDRWLRQAGSAQQAFEGDPAWTPQRRFGRLFERLALPGLARRGRYELLVILGGLGLFELQADALHFAAGPGAQEDLATAAAKRLFAIGDPLLLERRAAALAQDSEIALQALDLALANWEAGERATLGFPPHTCDEQALEGVRRALGL